MNDTRWHCEICDRPHKDEDLSSHVICRECYSQVEVNKLKAEVERLRKALGDELDSIYESWGDDT